MSSDTKKFIKGVTTGYIFMIVSLVVSLWLVPFVLRYLTKPEYGIFAIAGDLLGWLALANLGVSAAFNSKGAQLMGSKDVKELNIVASTTFYTQLVSSIVIIIVGAVVTLNPQLLFGSDTDAENIQMVVAILVAGFTISFIFQPLNSLLIASKQIHIDNYLKFGLLAIKTIITVILLMYGFKLLSLAISSIVATIVITIITWIRVKKTLPEIKIRIKSWKYNRFTFLLKNGVWFSIGGIAGILIFRMDSFLIGKYISLATVASFVITIKLYQIADQLHQQFFNTTRPYFAQVYGRNDMKTLSKMYDLAFNLSFVAAFTMGVSVLIINKWFIEWWVGPDFYLGDTISMLLCMNFILQASVLPNRILLASTFYQIVLHNITRISEGILKFVLSILFISQFGIKALVLAGIIGSVIFSNTTLNLITSRFFNESFFKRMTPFLYIFSIPIIIYFTDASILRIILLTGTTIVLVASFWQKIESIHNFTAILKLKITG